eukprot:gene19215-21852_t
MRQSKPSGNLKLSTVITGLTVLLFVLYCVYILPLLAQTDEANAAVPGKSVEIPKYDVYTATLAPKRTEGKPEPEKSTAPPIAKIDGTVDEKQTEVPPHISQKPSQPVESVEKLPVFPDALTFSSTFSPQSKSILEVGGTDGSGTRRVVQVLTQLGVVMVSEDPETYDIHADLVRGWPEVVTPVLADVHTLDYTPRQLSPNIQTRTRKSVAAILNQVEKDSTKPTSYKLAVGGVLPHPGGVIASKILHGFKAPVAMTLSPWFADLSPHFKLVHVLRDGRDLSFSANQGPVTKFFGAMYGNQHIAMSPQVKSIKLWSDWNAQVNIWAKRYHKEVEAINSRDKSFGYIAVHSEDMVSPSIPVRFAAISHLAEFVGSSLSELQLCCLALQESGFMGSHDRTPINKQAAGSVSKRYGKWHTFLAKDPQLSESIHREGKEGLRIFGYEPERLLADENMQSKGGFQCSAEQHNEACGVNKRQTLQQVAQGYGGGGVCTTKGGLDYIGGDIDAVVLTTPEQGACCSHCKARSDCKYFVVNPNTNMCYLKSSNQGTKSNDNLISGAVI